MSDLKKTLNYASSELYGYIAQFNSTVIAPSAKGSMKTCQDLSEAALEVESLQAEIARLKADNETLHRALDNVAPCVNKIKAQGIKEMYEKLGSKFGSFDSHDVREYAANLRSTKEGV